MQTNLLNKLAKIMLETKKENKSGMDDIVEVDLLEEKNKDTKEIKKELIVEIKKAKKEKIISPIQVRDLKKK